MNPDHLHDLARALWLASDPNDTTAARYSAAMETILTSRDDAPARPRAWVHSVLLYEAFTELEGRTPRESTRARATLSDDERHLGEWARYQRRHEKQLNVYQHARLDVSPAFAWDIRAAAWERSFETCLAHRARTGKLPRLNGADPEEFALARWLGRQLRELQLGRLDATRGRQLEALLRR